MVPIEILTYPSDSKGKSIEPKLISIEILTYPFDLTGTSHDFLFWCCSLMGFQNRTAQRDPKLQGQHSNRWCRRLCNEWSILIGIQVIHAVHIICIAPIYFIYIYIHIYIYIYTCIYNICVYIRVVSDECNVYLALIYPSYTAQCHNLLIIDSRDHPGIKAMVVVFKIRNVPWNTGWFKNRNSSSWIVTVTILNNIYIYIYIYIYSVCVYIYSG